jgi:phycoerythrin-associated linker protein
MDQHSAEQKLHTLYQNLLGRDIDAASLADQSILLADDEVTIKDIVLMVAHSPEYQARSRATHPLPTDQIALGYQHFLGRDLDPAGLYAHQQELVLGHTIDDVLDGIIESQEYAEKFGENDVPHA